MEHGADEVKDRKPSPGHAGRSPVRLVASTARLVFALALALIALYFGDQALEVARLPFSTLAFRDLLNALLMAMMCVIFACWAVITILARRKHAGKEKGGIP